MLPAYISHPECIQHEMGDDHPECPEGIGPINDLLLAKGQPNFLPPHDTPLITEIRLGRAQAVRHVHQLKARVPASGATRVDPDTQMISYSYQAAFRAAVETVWLPAPDEFKRQRRFISAGFDGRREDDMGNAGLAEADCEWATRQVMQVAARHEQGRVVSCVECGDSLSAPVRSVAAPVKMLIGVD